VFLAGCQGFVEAVVAGGEHVGISGDPLLEDEGREGGSNCNGGGR